MTVYFVQLDSQKQKSGTRKAVSTLNMYTKMSWLNAVLLFLQIYIF